MVVGRLVSALVGVGYLLEESSIEYEFYVRKCVYYFVIGTRQV